MKIFYIVVGKSINEYADYIHKSGYLTQKNSTYVSVFAKGIDKVISNLKENMKLSKEFTEINLIYIDGNKNIKS